MKTFIAETPNATVTFNLPTSLNEISAEYLKNVTADIRIADNYSLLGLVYHETLGSLIIAQKQNKKSITSGVIPVFIKCGKTDNEFINNTSCKDKLIISSTQLSLGYHAAAPKNKLSLDYFYSITDKDTNLFNRYKGSFGNELCYFVEFKIVPNCDIIGIYDSNISTNEITEKFVEVKER